MSKCGMYRYDLVRQESELSQFSAVPTGVFVMLNPSTADAAIDDPTIRRCWAFAQAWGKKKLIVLNLYACRATDPRDIMEFDDPVGPLNDQYLIDAGKAYPEFVVAWGKNAPKERVKQVVEMLTSNGAKLFCLGTNKDGSPKHPLYLRADAQLVPWGPV